MTKRIVSMMLVIVLLGAFAVPVHAHDVPDETRAGSITITMSYLDEAVPGGNLTLYRVADVATSNGDYYFTYTEDFAECSVPVTQLYSSELPAALAQIVEDKNLTGVTQNLDENGQTTFTELQLGLYLMIQTKAAPGYNKVSPFLVSVPGFANDRYIYDVDASPKVALEPKPTVPGTTAPPNLPQTGQNNWPVPVLAVAGLLVICAGWMLRAGEKKKKHES